MLQDTQKLISLIEKEECLWNVHSAVYSHAKLKVDAWLRIANELTSNWNEISQESQDQKIADIKKRWENIKVYYKRELSQQTPKHFCKKGAALLRFLNPTFGVKTGMLPVVSKSRVLPKCVPKRSVTPTFKLNIQQIPQPTKDASDKSSSLSSQLTYEVPDHLFAELPSSTSKRMRKSSDYGISNTKQIQATTGYLAANPNLAFLLSFAQDMEAMNSHDRIRFKSGMMDAIKLIRYPPNPDLV